MTWQAFGLESVEDIYLIINIYLHCVVRGQKVYFYFKVDAINLGTVSLIENFA